VNTRELSASRTRRHLAAALPLWPAKLPALDVDERELLTDWLRASAESRRWRTLLEAAGPARIELAARLADKALVTGLCTQKDIFERGRWQRASVVWVELESLQTALELPTRSGQGARKQALVERLATLAEDPLVGEAAQGLAESRLALWLAETRAALLGALRDWVNGGNVGLRRDFALRLGHTKAISDGDWRWLELHFDLPGLGISAFAPELTLAGQLSLCWCDGKRVDLAVAPFMTMPVDALLAVERAGSPARWWLIENRASFEKQALRREKGVALVWIAGRPTNGWADAMRRLLQIAPAPAIISADVDPAGIEIVLAAAQPWVDAGLAWGVMAMEPHRLDRAGLPPLGRYDRAVLDRLAARELPAELATLRDALSERGVKAEQEGWL